MDGISGMWELTCEGCFVMESESEGKSDAGDGMFVLALDEAMLARLHRT